MRAPEVQSAAFPTAHCSACDKIVLTYISIGPRLERNCAAASIATRSIEQRLEWIGADDLEDLGYYFGAPPGKACRRMR